MQQTIEESKAKRRGPKLKEDLRLKICDLGNGCWTYHHFSTIIQTRQYRSPEVIMGAKYGSTADIWSMACMVFELVTGDFLFEPRKGKTYGRDDDHLAQMMELLGRMPDTVAFQGQRRRRFFHHKGKLRRIAGLKYWPLLKVLTEKYRFRETEAHQFADFL
jgi:serine/threonine-protein kinase SRPK3